MRILHVVEPFSSGITTFIINLSSQLKSENHVVFHGSRATADTISDVRGRFDADVKFVLWDSVQREINPFKDIIALFDLIKFLRNEKFDTIHLHSSKAGFLGRIACFILRIKNVIYTPNSAPFAREDIGFLKKRLFIFLEKVAYYLAGEIISCGQSEWLLYKYWGMKSICINNAISISSEMKPKDNIGEPLRVVFAGIASYQKNPRMFNEIAKEFYGDKNFEFVWVGDGPLSDELNPELMTITGWANSECVEKQISEADIFLSTAQWEGQPFSVLEAMNSGKCLILYNCVGNRDLVIDGENGYLFQTVIEAKEKIKMFVNDRNLLNRMGLKSRKICKEKHDIKINAEFYKKEYERVATKK